MEKSKKIKSPTNNSNKQNFLPETIDVNYLKTPNYRTYHVDGIYGGLTTQSKIYVELFIERSATPQKVKHKVESDGKLGGEIKRIGKKGIIREIESGLIMDIKVAEALKEWLEDKIDDLRKIESKIKGMKTK